MAENLQAFAKEKFEENASARIEYYKEALKFISKLFCDEMFPYSITSLISNLFLYNSNTKDFVIYPSNANNLNSANFAFHPNIADNYLRFEKVIRFRVEKFEKDEFSVSVGQVGELENSNIVWRKPNKDELDFGEFPEF